MFSLVFPKPVTYDTLSADWHWYRFEYQARGSTHAHGYAKFRIHPGICALVEKRAAAWGLVDEQHVHVSSQFHSLSEEERVQIVQEGEEARQLCCVTPTGWYQHAMIQYLMICGLFLIHILVPCSWMVS